MDLGPFGVWCPQLRTRDQAKAEEISSGLEYLGFTTVWVPGGTGGPVFEHVTTVLRSTRRITVATGVVNMLMHEPEDTAEWFAAMEHEHPGRLLLGLGASHAKRAAEIGRPYRPLAATAEYLDRLDAAAEPVPPNRRMLGALGPRMLDVARERTGGAHTYIVTPDHTGDARSVLGPGKLLAPVVKVVPEADPAVAAAAARAHLGPYLELASYRGSLLRMGYGDEDLAGNGSDRLLADLFVLGDPGAVVARADAHRAAGADHVCVQVVTGDRRDVPWDAWRAVASAFEAPAAGAGGRRR